MCSLLRGLLLCPLFEVPFIGGFTVNLGESGLVYRGYINSGELVAVKTGKGNYHVTMSSFPTFNC